MLEKTELEKLFAGIDFGKEFYNSKQRLHEFNEVIVIIDTSKWNEIKAESLCKMREINHILKNYKIGLLGNQKLTFKSNQSELEDLLDNNSIIKKTVLFFISLIIL